MPSRITTCLLRACLSLVLLLSGLSGAWATSARKLIEQGNAAFRAGQFEQALSAYDEASVDAPESPEIYYNRGAVLYRQEDYEGAKEAFEKAALKSMGPELESRARYNLGNCAFREAERQHDSDLKKSLESCEAAVKHYQDAMRRSPDMKKAAENIEIVRLYMKALLDEIEKQKQEQEQQQQQQEDLAKKLKELIERQRKASADNQNLLMKQRQPNAAQQQQEIALGMEDLTKEQGGIQTDSEAVSKQVLEAINQHAASAQGQPGATNQPAADPQQMAQMQEKLGKVKEHVDNAIGQQAQANQKLGVRQLEQAQANQKLGVRQLEQAQPNQQASEQELTKALEALKDENQQQQQQQQQQPGNDDEKEDEDKDEKGEQQQQQQGGDDKEKGKDEKEQEQEQQMQAAKAEDILNEEKDQREQRQRQMPMRFRAVDKNW